MPITTVLRVGALQPWRLILFHLIPDTFLVIDLGEGGSSVSRATSFDSLHGSSCLLHELLTKPDLSTRATLHAPLTLMARTEQI
ncbi:hypothetical protein RRG08_010190 [Elysia crispata]|uniref:Uncharacterized protein n=1 Tax=Elysia crispata TaxID=231223 RepID=A0AAE1DZP2_9GAST|nr:hypothetical protein RRG08_010190 [Elysia crispata]